MKADTEKVLNATYKWRKSRVNSSGKKEKKKIKTQFTDIYNSQLMNVYIEHAYDKFPII